LSADVAEGVATLRARCECDLCRLGVTTALHSDPSHDQRLVQTFQLGAASVRIVGGTTKCARVMVAYALEHPEVFAGKRVLELGSGAGLVAITLAVALGCEVDATDQEPVLDLLGDNIAANTDPARHVLRASVLQWGEALDAWGDHDLVVGADLNFAREGLAPLAATIDALVTRPTQALVLASIRRAAWEGALFEALAASFDVEPLAEVDEVRLHRFVRRAAPPAAT